MAEETDLIVLIVRWVLADTCGQARQLGRPTRLPAQPGQGFLFVRPMGSAEFTLAVAEHRAARTVLAAS